MTKSDLTKGQYNHNKEAASLITCIVEKPTGKTGRWRVPGECLEKQSLLSDDVIFVEPMENTIDLNNSVLAFMRKNGLPPYSILVFWFTVLGSRVIFIRLY